MNFLCGTFGSDFPIRDSTAFVRSIFIRSNRYQIQGLFKQEGNNLQIKLEEIEPDLLKLVPIKLLDQVHVRLAIRHQLGPIEQGGTTRLRAVQFDSTKEQLLISDEGWLQESRHRRSVAHVEVAGLGMSLDGLHRSIRSRDLAHEASHGGLSGTNVLAIPLPGHGHGLCHAVGRQGQVVER